MTLAIQPNVSAPPSSKETALTFMALEHRPNMESLCVETLRVPVRIKAPPEHGLRTKPASKTEAGRCLRCSSSPVDSVSVALLSYGVPVTRAK